MYANRGPGELCRVGFDSPPVPGLAAFEPRRSLLVIGGEAFAGVVGAKDHGLADPFQFQEFTHGELPGCG